MSVRCGIVCPTACSNCDILGCEDRIAPQAPSAARAELDAAAAVGMTVPELFDFWHGTTRHAMTPPTPYEDRRDDVKGADELQHCGMADDLICRHCHEENCGVRKAKRVF